MHCQREERIYQTPFMNLLGYCSSSAIWKHRSDLEFLISIRSRTFPLSLSQRGQRREKMKRGRGVKSKYVAPCLPWLSCTLIDSGLPIPLTCLLCLPSPHTRLSCQSGRKIERQGILRYSPGARLWSFDWLNGFPKLLVLFHQLPLALNNLCQAEMRDRKVGRNWADELRYCGKFKTRVCWIFDKDFDRFFDWFSVLDILSNSYQKCPIIVSKVSKNVQICLMCPKKSEVFKLSKI